MNAISGIIRAHEALDCGVGRSCTEICTQLRELSIKSPRQQVRSALGAIFRCRHERTRELLVSYKRKRRECGDEESTYEERKAPRK